MNRKVPEGLDMQGRFKPGAQVPVKRDWRTQTLATKLWHRHEHSGRVDTAAKPSRTVYPTVRRSAWSGFMTWVVYGAAMAVVVVWAVREVLHG